MYGRCEALRGPATERAPCRQAGLLFATWVCIPGKRSRAKFAIPWTPRFRPVSARTSCQVGLMRCHDGWR